MKLALEPRRFFVVALAVIGSLAVGSCAPVAYLLPQPGMVRNASYTVDARSGAQLATTDAAFTVDCRAGEQRRAILRRTVPLVEWQAPGAEIVADGDWYWLWTRQAGEQHVTLRFLVPVTAPSPGVHEVTVPTVLALSGELTTLVPAGTGEIKSTPAAMIGEDRTADGERRVRFFLPAGPQVTLRWQDKAAEAARQANILARCDESVEVRHGLLVRRSEVACQVSKAAIEELRLEMPAGSVVRHVAGADVLRWTIEDSGKVHVTLSRKVKDSVSLTVFSEVTAGAAPAEITIAPLSVVGVERQEGTLRLHSTEDLELVEVSVDGAQRSGVSGGPDAGGLVYLYRRAPASIRLRVAEREPKVEIRSESLATIEAGVLTLESRLQYDIQRRAVRSLSAALPADSTVLSVQGPDVLDWSVGDGRLAMRLKRAVLGRTDVTVRLQQGLVRINGILIPRLAHPDADRDEGLIGVSAGGGVQLRPDQARLVDQVDVTALPEWMRASAKLAYRYRQPGGMLSVSTERIVPQLVARTFEVVEIGQDLLLRTFYLDGQVSDAPVFDVTLAVPGDLVPLRVRGDQVADWELRPATDSGKSHLVVTLARGTLGRVTVTLECSRTVSHTELRTLESIDVPAARRLAGGLLLVGRDYLATNVISSEGLDSRPVETIRVLAPDFAGPTDSPWPVVGFRHAGPWSARLNVQQRVPRIATTAVSLLRLRHGQLSAETSLRCGIVEAGVSQLAVRLPAGAVNSYVDGPGIRSRRLDSATNTWTVALDQRRLGTYPLTVTYDRLLPADGRVEHEEPTVVGAVSQKGFLLVGKDQPSTDVTVSDEGHLRRATAADLPSWHGLKLDVPIVETLEYSGRAGPDWKLAVTARQLGEANVVDVRAIDCFLQTVINRDGTALTFMTLTLENTRRQFARVSLPPGKVLWAAYVDEKPVKPVEAPAPAAAGGGTADKTYLVPLLGMSRPGAKSFELTVVYAEEYPSFAGRTAQLDFTTPPVDVPTGSMSWQVFLPPGYHVMGEIGKRVGNMQLLTTPPDAEVPPAEELFGPDAERWDRVWPAIRPYVAIAGTVLLYVVLGIVSIGVVVLVFVALFRAAERRREREAARLAAGEKKREHHPLRWAAVFVLIVVFIVVVAALFTPSMMSYYRVSVKEVMGRKAEPALASVHASLEQYVRTYGKYPKSLEGVTTEWGEGREDYSGFRLNPETVEIVAGDKKASDVRGEDIVAVDTVEGGYNVLHKDGRVEWVPDEDRRRLAGKLYFQDSLDNTVVKEDLKEITEAEAERAGQQMAQSKQLRGRSRRAVDELTQNETARILMERAEQRYKDIAEKDKLAAANQAGERADFFGDTDAADREKMRQQQFQEQALDIVLEAQKEAGIKSDLALSKPSTATRPAVAPSETPPSPGADMRPPADEGRPAGPSGPEVAAGEPESEPGPAKPEQPSAGRPVRLQGKHGEALVNKWETWSTWQTEQSAAPSFAPVTAGRSKGNLPIGLEPPDAGRMPYVFVRPFGAGGADVGQFKVTAARAGTGYTVYIIAILAGLGVAASALRLVVGRLYRRHDAGSQNA